MEYEFGAHDLRSLLQTAAGEFESKLSEKSLAVETRFPSIPVFADCDGERIIQVIGNLLANAIKFSPANSVITLATQEVETLPESMPEAARRKLAQAGSSTRFAQVLIQDGGPGVPDEHRERIFEKFHQVKQDGKPLSAGTGLGLAISRTIIDAHSGSIWAQNNPGGGACFCFLLPMGTRVGGSTRVESPPI